MGAGLLLLGHTDVVPVGDGWTRDPFGGAIEDGRMYGRGASDMKGGLAASLSAMAALRGAGLSGPVELAALIDEEETGIGIGAYVESASIRFLGCITAEPTDLQTVVGARGASYLRVEIHGSACHAGKPDDGANAIYGAAAAPGGWTAACDGGFVARDLGVPVVVLGPGSVADQAHRPDESVAIEELVIAARAYALTALRLLG